MSIPDEPVRRDGRRSRQGTSRTEEIEMKYMLIMRATAEAVEAYKDLDFEQVINAMGAYNESMMKAIAAESNTTRDLVLLYCPLVPEPWTRL